MVDDAKTARRIRSLLASEGLIPNGMDPWEAFDRPQWSTTDFERNVKFQRAQTKMVEDHIKSIRDVDNAELVITFPKKELFRSDQNPVTASLTITPRPGSDITTNRKKIEGIRKLLKYAIEGLKDENIVILDHTGLELDVSGMEPVDRIELIKKENEVVQKLEGDYTKRILESLQQTFSADRVRVVNIKFDMDMSKRAVNTEEFFPITMTERDPALAYDNSVRIKSITRSQSTSDTRWKGTGFNPEGPAGVEGHVPPAYSDMSNLYGEMEQKNNTQNEEINRKLTQEEKSPQIDRVTVSVNIDGTWKKKYDEKGKPVILPDNTIDREYVPVPPEELRAALNLVRDAIGYRSARGDSVTVENVKIDRTAQFREEDEAYFRRQQLQTTIVVFLSGLTILLISFIIFRMVSREMERRRRLAEEERSRREQAMRESAIMQAEEEGVDVSISVEERTRMELLESVLNMAKEHPEDCAQLIRTWLLEE
jgi:flagellar M-ring protein FliF